MSAHSACAAFASFLALALQLLVPDARAQEAEARSVVVLAIDPRLRVAVEPIASGLAASLDVEVRITEPGDPSAGVRLYAAGRRAVRIEVTAASGRTARRRVTLPRREDERAAALVIHLENLLRDDAAALIERLRREREARAAETAAGSEESESASESAAESVSESEPETASVAESVSESASETEPASESVSVSASETEPASETASVSASETVSETETASETETETASASDAESSPEPDNPYHTLLRIGLGTQLSGYDDGTRIDLVWWAGLHVAVTVTEWLAIGVREIGTGYGTDGSLGPGGVLFAELSWRPDTLLDFHVAFGGHFQAVLPQMAPVVFGFATVAALGTRFWAHPNVSIGLDTELRWIATNTFQGGIPTLVNGDVLVSGGLSVCAHL